jgi:dienelactone hydrolase
MSPALPYAFISPLLWKLIILGLKYLAMKSIACSRITCRLSVVMALLMILPAMAVYGQKQRTMRYSTRSAKKAEVWQAELRSKLAVLMKVEDLIGTGKSIPLDMKEIRTENMGDYLLKEIEFNTTTTRRIRVLITCPLKSTGPWPAVVCMHGHGGTPGIVYEKASLYNGFADELARRNYVTIAPVVSQHDVYEAGRTLMGERLWDCMRCVDYLYSCFSVDSTRIGCAGLSLGGEMAMWLGAMDTRIVATVSCGFLTRMDQMEQGHCMCWKFPGLRELVDYSDIYCLTAPRALMCQNGLKEPPADFTVELARAAMKEIEVIYYNFSQPEKVSLVAHPGAHVVDVPSLLIFFKKYLTPIKATADEQ